jgi:hypothetical protein
MNTASKKTNLIGAGIHDSLAGLGIVTGTFFASVLLEKPHLAWLILFVAYVTGQLKNLLSKSTLRYLKAFVYGLVIVAVFTLFLLSTGGRTVFFGSIAEAQFAQVTDLFCRFAIVYAWGTALVEFFLGFLEKKTKINFMKMAPLFMWIALAAFALLLLNINSLLPWLKPYDYLLILLMLAFTKVSLTLANKKPAEKR